MTEAQKILVNEGGELAVLKWSEYERLLELASQLEDIRDYHSIKSDPGELVSHEVVKRLAEGDNPYRVWREYRGISARELAKKCGVTVAHLSQIETGKRDPSLTLLKRLAGNLEVDVDELIWS